MPETAGKKKYILGPTLGQPLTASKGVDLSNTNKKELLLK